MNTRGDETPSLQNVIESEQYFGMSHQAMLWRLVSEGYLMRPQLDAAIIRDVGLQGEFA